MDIIAIEQAIEQLEQSATTVSNVNELATLYIVRQNMKDTLQTAIDGSNDGLKECLLPCYTNYVDLKQKYQQNEITEDAIITSIKSTCQELFEFIRQLYSCTDCKRERDEIRKLIQNLSNLNY